MTAQGFAAKTFRMDVLATAKAAELVDVSVQTFHRLAAKHGIKPSLKAEGQTGAMFWLRSDVERLRDKLAAERAS